jgi:hypothetical protein
VPNIEGALAVCDAILVENDLVFNCIIDQAKIDQTIMVTDEEEVKYIYLNIYIIIIIDIIITTITTTITIIIITIITTTIIITTIIITTIIITTIIIITPP